METIARIARLNVPTRTVVVTSFAQDELVLGEVARVLRPGGRFLQELANREALVRGWHDSDVTRTGDGLVVLDASGRVEFASPNATSAFRRMGTNALPLGQPFPQRAAILVAGAMAGSRPVEAEIEADGAVSDVRIVPLLQGTGRRGALALVREVTELRRLDRDGMAAETQQLLQICWHVRFGAFTLAFVTYTVVINATRGLATDPLLVRYSGDQDTRWRLREEHYEAEMEQLAGSDVVYTVTVKGIKRRVLPVLDDAERAEAHEKRTFPISARVDAAGCPGGVIDDRSRGRHEDDFRGFKSDLHFLISFFVLAGWPASFLGWAGTGGRGSFFKAGRRFCWGVLQCSLFPVRGLAGLRAECDDRAGFPE